MPAENHVLLFTGAQGSGKSWLGMDLARYWDQEGKRRRRVVLDVKGDWGGAGLQVERISRELAAGKPDYSAFLAAYPQVVFDLAALPAKERRQEVDRIALAVHQLGSALFVLDEAYEYLSEDAAGPELESLVRDARRSRVDVFALGHRLTDFATWVRSIASAVVMFHEHEPAQLRVAASWIGKGAADILPTLPLGQNGDIPEYLLYDARRGKLTRAVSRSLSQNSATVTVRS